MGQTVDLDQLSAEALQAVRMVRVRDQGMSREDMMILAAQCQAARGLLNWSVAKLSRQAGVSISYISEFEHGRLVPQFDANAKLVAALADAGVDLLTKSNGSIGVFLQVTDQHGGEVPVEVPS